MAVGKNIHLNYHQRFSSRVKTAGDGHALRLRLKFRNSHEYLDLGNIFRPVNEENASRQYLHDLFNSVEFKDEVKLNAINDVDMLERIIAYITANIGSTFSSTAISKFLKSEGRSVTSETVLNYIRACTDAFLFYQVKRQDLQGKKI